jgi:geranylgeranyl diphosphate synthase type II
MNNIQNNNELEDFLTKIDDQIILLGEPSILSEKSLKESKIYHLNTGGSKFRCKVIFNVCKLYNISINNAETIALTLENLHQASLIHDDIQDEDEIRRSFKTIWTKESIKKALLVGDMMIFESIKTLLNLENTSIEQLKLVFENCLDNLSLMVAAQNCELDLQKKEVRLNYEEYRTIVLHKTLPFFYLSFSIPAILSNVKEKEIVNLKKELEEISLIYQIIDDYEDFEKKEVVNFFKLTDNLYEYLDDKDKIKNFLLSKVNKEIKINKIKSDKNSVIYNYILEQCSKKIDKIFL